MEFGEGVVEREFLENFVEDLDLGEFVGGGKGGTLVKVFGILGDDFRAEAVKGMNGDFVGFATDEADEALAHVLGGVVGEGEAEDCGRKGVGFLEDVGDAQGEEFGFA